MAAPNQPMLDTLIADIRSMYGIDLNVSNHLKLFEKYLTKGDFKEAKKQATLIRKSILDFCGKERTTFNEKVRKGLQTFIDSSSRTNDERGSLTVSARSDHGIQLNARHAPIHTKTETLSERQIIDQQEECLEWFANAIYELHECLATPDNKPYAPATCPSSLKSSEHILKNIMKMHIESREDVRRVVRSTDDNQTRTNSRLNALRDSIKHNQFTTTKGNMATHHTEENDSDIITEIEKRLQAKFQELNNLETLPSEINRLSCEIREVAYDEQFNKPPRPEKIPGLDDINEIRHILKEKQGASKQMSDNMAAVEKEIRKLKDDIERSQYEKGDKVPGKEPMFEDLRCIRSILNSRQTKSKSENKLSDVSGGKSAGVKLTDGSPESAQLRDLNRPSKIAEGYVELYDNEWTDAFDILENYNKSEEETVRVLLDILQKAYAFCDEVSQKQTRTLKTTLLCPVQHMQSIQHDEPTSFAEVHTQMISDMRKQTADVSVEDVIRHFMQRIMLLPMSDNHKAYIETYIRKCIQLCWLMCVQSPPVYVDVRFSENFDTDKFKTYTLSARNVSFLVWPPLYLEKDGAILCKGVAQEKS